MYIGRALPRQEDNRFLTGRGEYTEDLKFADCAHAAVVRSPHAHALICSIELADAESAPGVLCVLDGERWNAHQIGNDLLLEAEVGFPDGRPMNKVPRPVLPAPRRQPGRPSHPRSRSRLFLRPVHVLAGQQERATRSAHPWCRLVRPETETMLRVFPVCGWLVVSCSAILAVGWIQFQR